MFNKGVTEMLTERQISFLDEVVALCSTKFPKTKYAYRDISSELSDCYDVDSPKGYYTNVVEFGAYFGAESAVIRVYFCGDTVMIGEEPRHSYEIFDLSDSNCVNRAAFILM